MNKFIFYILVSLSLPSVADQEAHYYREDGFKIVLSPYSFTGEMDKDSADYYINSESIVVGVTDRLILKLKKGIELKIYLDAFNLELLDEIAPDTFLLRVSSRSDTLSITNQIYDTQGVEYVHPDFIKRRLRR